MDHRCHSQQLAAKFERLRSLEVGHKAEVPDADKALREHVQQEPADELFGRDGHRALYVSMSVVPPTESHVVTVKREQSMIGDGDAMRVTAEITQYLFWTAKRRFGVDDPFVPMQLLHERGETVSSGKVLDLAVQE